VHYLLMENTFYWQR